LKELVSILMPVKNAGQYLRECLESIILQTYKNWELIAIDDHSEDNSYSTLLEYSFKDDRIQVFKNHQKGIIPALQMAYARSNGKLITRMDADDIMLLEKIEYLKGNLDKHGPGHIALGLVEYFSEHELGNGYRTYETWLNSLTYYGINFEEIYKECVIPSPCWMVNRSDFEIAGAFQSQLYPEDYDLAFRFYKAGLKCIKSNHVLHQWRDHPERASRNDKNYENNRFFELKLKYFLDLERDFSRPLVLWGAGKRGKELAQKMVNQELDFFWVSNNLKKVGKNIYGRVIQRVVYVEALKKPQIIVNISSPLDQNAIRAYLDAQLLEAIEDYFFFC